MRPSPVLLRVEGASLVGIQPRDLCFGEAAVHPPRCALQEATDTQGSGQDRPRRKPRTG